MRRATKPTHIKPELVTPGDMIEVRWERDGIRFSVTAYVGYVDQTTDPFRIMAANNRTLLASYLPGVGVLKPYRKAEIWRHRAAPTLEGLFND